MLRDEDGELTGLVALRGLFGTRVVIMPVDEIATVDPPSRRVTLFDRPELERSEHFSEALRNHGSRPID